MIGRSRRDALVTLVIDRSGGAPLHRQLYDQLRATILGGGLGPGDRLPSTRALARELGVARNTVLAAFDELLAEGYLVGAIGSGTFVSPVLPDALLGADGEPRATESKVLAPAPDLPTLSCRGAALAALSRPRGGGRRAFMPGLPAFEAFPFELWARLLARPWRRPARHQLAYGDPAGDPDLRAAIAAYLRAFRSLSCTADQVIVVSGAQNGLDLVARLLLDPGDTALIEEPSYPGLRGALVGAGAEIISAQVDLEGLDVAAGERWAPNARLVCVTPSHQFPLGVTMSLGRRLALLDWATRAGAWIVEDDYDSEYRYAGRPLAALQGLDRSGCVIYVGSFSKVLFPSLRLGYLVVPPTLAEPFRRARAALDDHPSSVAQRALAWFILDGHFAAHVRRTRRLYAARREALISAAQGHLSDLLAVRPSEAGMHLVADLAPGLARRMTDRQAAARADAAGISAPALSQYYAWPGTPQALLLGFAAVPADEIGPAAERLAAVLAGQ